MIRQFWRFLRSTPTAANIFAIAALGVWIAKVVFFDYLPPIFPKAFELGKVFEGLLSAVIAAWIFYLFFALLPEWKQKTVVAPYMLRKVALLVGDCQAVLEELGRASGKRLSFARASQEDIEQAFARIPYDRQVRGAKGGQTPGTWLELFHYRRQRSEQTANEVVTQSRFVEPEIVALTLRVRESAFFIMSRAMEGYDASYKYLSVFADNFFNYLTDCRALATWHDANCHGVTDPILPHLD